MTVYFNSGTTGTYFGNPTGSGLYFNTGRAPLNLPLVFRELDTSTAAIVNAATIKPSTQRQVDMDNLVRDLKAVGVWNSLDLLYVLANETSQLSLLNWKSPSTFAATPTNNPTFTQDRGFTGNGSSAFLGTTWNFSTNGSAYTRDNASVGAWSLTATPNTVGIIGSAANAYVTITPRGGTGTQMRIRMNAAAFAELGDVPDARGLSVAERTNATTIQGYRNGVLFGSPQTIASEVLTNDTFTMLRALNTYYFGQMALGYIGSSLTATQHASMYNAFLTYLRAVGAVT